ncbi:MAG: PKD domain-containing protein [Bacteroidales bacterium]|nr:PKD domain-containing protein [Bacteroidales bacterium]
MKKTLLLLAGMLCFVIVSKSQSLIATPTNDTASFPYWIQMMQNPSGNFFKTQRAFNLFWKDRKITRGCGWKVFKRWEYMMQSRILPDGSFPDPTATFNMYEQYRKTPQSISGNWINLGPSQIPAPGPSGYEGLGRLNVVAFHPSDPNKFYAGSPSGGLWQTTDGGNTWVTYTDTLATLGVSAIVVDYTNPNKILIGTGDRDAGDAPGLGIFKSLDGGITWTPSQTGMGNVTVCRIIQHPTNSQIYIAATTSGIYRSTDGGTNWVQTKTGGFKDILFKPNDPNFIYAVAGADFYRSTDNGLSFVKITSGLTSGQRAVIAVTPANPAYVYFLQSNNGSGFQGLFRSTNSGLTFSTQSTTPNILNYDCSSNATGGQAWYDLALAADPNNAEIIFVGGINVQKSINGGVTWTVSSHWVGSCGAAEVHADCHFLTFSPVNAKLYACNDGGLWVSPNSGITWNDLTVGMTIGQIYKIGQSQTVRDEIINGFQDNGTYTLTPTGWVATGGGDGMECAVDYSNAAYTYHTIYYGDIYRKYNLNNEVHIAGNGIKGITESGAWVTPFCLGEGNSKRMFIGYKNIWRTEDVTLNSFTWTKISDNLAGTNTSDMSVIENSPANPNILYAARSDNRLFRSDNCLDNVPTWVDLTSYLPTSGTPTDVEAHPTDQNIVYMTLGTKVYKSVNKGLAWINITGNLPAIHISTITYYKNAQEGLYIGTDAGVYYKDESTGDWILFSAGLPANGRVTELEIYYDNDSISRDVIRASTYGRGLWSSNLYQSSPQADFIADKTLAPIGCPINFLDQSSGVPTYFEWTFTGGSPASSTLKNPSNIVYSVAGSYPVKLKAWNETGSDSTIKTGYITISSTLTPEVNFTADKFVLCSNEIVHFTDQTLNCPSSWTWQFEPNSVMYLEGTTKNSQNPIVQFSANGTYNVQLTCTNAVGSSSTQKPGFIVKGGYTLPFEESFESGFDQHHWQVVNPDFSITWDTISVGGTVNGSKAAWMNFFEYTRVDSRDQLISPALDLTGFGIVTLNFKHAYAQRARKDSLIVKISQDCGTTWERILAAGPNGTPTQFVTHEPITTAFYPESTNDWCGGSYGVGCYSIDLTPWSGKRNIKLMFESFNRFGNNLFLNDITVSGPVGIPSQITQEPIKIFPNPTTGKLFISINDGTKETQVSLLNLQGQRLFTCSLTEMSNNAPHELDFSMYPKGVYFLKVTSHTTSKITKIIINL